MKLISGFILKAAVEPRIDTDGHGYQELDYIDRFTRKVTSVDSHLSVLIRVYLWLTCLGFSATAEFRSAGRRMFTRDGH